MRRAAAVSPLAAVSLLAAACAGARSPADRPVHGVEAEALALADEYVAHLFARYPEWATIAGYPGADHGALTDNRAEAFSAWRADEDRLLARVRALGGIKVGSDAWVALESVREVLESSVGLRACRAELWGVSSAGPSPMAFPTAGWASWSASLAEVQPVGTPELRRAAVSRARALPAWVDREIALLREGVRAGFTASRDNVDRAVAELDALLETSPAAWAHLAPAERDLAPGFREALAEAARALAPAARRYRDYLASEYLASARRDPGVGGFPGGGACYRAAIRDGTSLEHSADDLHALGLARVRASRAEMRGIAERDFGTADVAALLARLDASPEHRYRSREQVLDRARAALDRAESALTRAFSTLPRRRPVVRPYPDTQARAGAPDSSTGSMEGDGYAGVYFVNTWAPEKRSMLTGESTAFHETVPGHVLQWSIALERAGPKLATRFLAINAYSEGWALYAERLADELGLFSGPADRLGMLRAEAFRAARLVVDTGLHARGWSRARAAAYLGEATGRPAEQYLAEVDRYGAWPGQALGYAVGALEIRLLRDEAQAALGTRFDLRAFHAVVLEHGSVPLRVLDERVRRWVAGEARRAPR